MNNQITTLRNYQDFQACRLFFGLMTMPLLVIVVAGTLVAL